MVIDVDDELFFEIDQAGPIYVGAFNDENGIVRAIDRGGYANCGGAGKLLISMRCWVAHGDFDVFVECAQQPVETERGPEAVTVRPDVRSNRKAILFFNEFNYLAKHWWISDCGLRNCGFKNERKFAIHNSKFAITPGVLSFQVSHRRAQLPLRLCRARSEAREY